MTVPRARGDGPLHDAAGPMPPLSCHELVRSAVIRAAMEHGRAPIGSGPPSATRAAEMELCAEEIQEPDNERGCPTRGLAFIARSDQVLKVQSLTRYDPHTS